MNKKPIIFSGPMIRAILEGRKTQTRRVIKPQPTNMDDDRRRLSVLSDCRYQPGDHLWVREAWTPYEDWTNSQIPYLYAADYPEGLNVLWKPSIHMPREASRLTLGIVKVRVERVQDINEIDAIAEGVMVGKEGIPNIPLTRRAAFRILWDSLNAKREYSWESNPLVWCVEFKRIAREVER